MTRRRRVDTPETSANPPGRMPLGFIRPPKPIGEMSDAERRAFARVIGDAFVGRLEQAKAAVEEDLAREREEREEKRDRFLKTCVGLMTIFGGLPLAIEIYKALHH